MIKRRKMRLNGVWRRVAINRVYELSIIHRVSFFHTCLVFQKIISKNDNFLVFNIVDVEWFSQMVIGFYYTGFP
jgi:hypothetical protein